MASKSSAVAEVREHLLALQRDLPEPRMWSWMDAISEQESYRMPM